MVTARNDIDRAGAAPRRAWDTAEWRAALQRAWADHGTLAGAAQALGIGRQTLKDRLRQDPGMKAALGVRQGRRARHGLYVGWRAGVAAPPLRATDVRLLPVRGPDARRGAPPQAGVVLLDLPARTLGFVPGAITQAAWCVGFATAARRPRELRELLRAVRLDAARVLAGTRVTDTGLVFDAAAEAACRRIAAACIAPAVCP